MRLAGESLKTSFVVNGLMVGALNCLGFIAPVTLSEAI